MKKLFTLLFLAIPYSTLAYGDVIFVEPSGVVWAFSALVLTVIISMVYILIFFFLLFVITWLLLQVLVPIYRFLAYD